MNYASFFYEANVVLNMGNEWDAGERVTQNKGGAEKKNKKKILNSTLINLSPWHSFQHPIKTIAFFPIIHTRRSHLCCGALKGSFMVLRNNDVKRSYE